MICLSAGAQRTPPAYSITVPPSYIRVWDATTPGQDKDLIQEQSVQDVRQTTQYVDGLGRPVQTVIKQGSLPSGGTAVDMVSLMDYDNFGREVYKYLSFGSTATDGTQNNGQFKTDAFQQQVAFFNTQLAGQPGETNLGPNHLNWAYSKVNYEQSPRDRPLSTYAPGIDWAGSEVVNTPGSGKCVKTAIYLNSVTDSVRIWTVTDVPGGLGTYSTVATFSANKLIKTIQTDENGKQTIEFNDNEGRTLLKKEQLTAAADNGSGAGYTGWLCTYYIYDDLNNLRCVASPKAVEVISGSGWTLSQAVANELCFRYEYDGKRRLIKKRTPGVEEIRMVYDVRDRLVMTQDSVLRSQQKWEVFCYDALNRQDTVALMTDAGHYNDHAWHLSQAKTQAFYPVTAGYPTEVVTQFYYDSYDWVTALGNALTPTMSTTYNSNSTYFFTTYNTVPAYAQPMQQYSITRGMGTGYRTKIIDTNTFLYYIPFYDDHGRVIGTQSTNYNKGIDQQWTQYDFSGKPLRKLLLHKKSTGNPEGHLVNTKYTYDVIGRLTSTRKGMDGVEQRIDSMKYDALGQLQTKTLGNNIESQTYDYNIRGWMTAINKQYVTGTTGNYFGMELAYENSPSGITSYTTPQFSGNIAGIVWKSAGDGINKKYDFSYDKANRLTGAAYTQYNGTTFAQSATIDFSVPNITYDANGNIMSMVQKGFKIGGSVSIDRLRYSYFPNTNRLQQVYDTANDVNSLLGDIHYDPATKDPTTDYTYDANGRLIADKNKGISKIEYNFLHLPSKISMVKPNGSSKGNIVYKYDAMGNKWAKIITDSTLNPVRITTITYARGFEYRNDTIQYVAHEEGRTRYFWEHYMNGDSTFRMRFDYFVKDHLGNTRVVLADQKDTAQYVATMEAAYRAKENKLFYNIPATAYPRNLAGGYPVDLATTNPNDSVIRLGNNGQKVGPAIILKVMSGDKVTIAANYYFNAGGNTGGQQLNAQDLINSLANGIVSVTGGSHGSFGDLTGSSTPLTGALNSFIGGNNTTVAGKPNAYLNYVLMDNQFAYVSTPGQSGALQVATAGTAPGGGLQSPLATTINIKTSGYLYIYVSNASPTWDVFFDNLSVMHYAGPMVEENHYYPFGLTMAGVSDKALKQGYGENKYRYNSKELQNKEFSDGSGLEEYDYGARLYDAQIGRWQVGDPMAENYANVSPYCYGMNNPVSTIDPNGMEVRSLSSTTIQEMIANAWDQTAPGTHSTWNNIGGTFVNEDDFQQVEKEVQNKIANGRLVEALKYLTSNVPSLDKWADWSLVDDINGNNNGTNSLFETRPNGKNPGKADLSVNGAALKKYDGSSKVYSIAGLAFALYHEFYHINIIGGKHKDVAVRVGGFEKGMVNPQEEFLASYYASKAELPKDAVMANYYYMRSISALNNIINYAYDPAKYINLYGDKIKELLKNVDESHRQQAIGLIKGIKGVTLKF